MDRQTFESLTLEEQLRYVNERSKFTTRQIGEEIGMPPSSLSNLFSDKGYRRVKGKYVKKEQQPQKQSSMENPLQELLKYKDQLIKLASQEQHQHHHYLDFSILDQFKIKDMDTKKGKFEKETITFDLPKPLSEQLNEVVSKRGYKKQSLLSLLIYEFLQNEK